MSISFLNSFDIIMRFALLDGIEPLIKMIKNDNPDVREAASMALANLTTANINNCHEVRLSTCLSLKRTG